MVAVTAAELAKEFKADPKATHARYAGKSIEVSGVIHYATSDNAIDTPRVALRGIEGKSLDLAAQVYCGFPAAEEDRVNQLPKDQSVKIRGTLNDTDQAVLLDNCEFVEFGPSPAIPIGIAELMKAFTDDVEKARTRFHDKSLVLEGKVVEANWSDTKSFVLFTLEGGEPVAKVKIHCPCMMNERIKAKLGAIQVGQKLKLLTECMATEFDDTPTLKEGRLLK